MKKKKTLFAFPLGVGVGLAVGLPSGVVLVFPKERPTPNLRRKIDPKPRKGGPIEKTQEGQPQDEARTVKPDTMKQGQPQDQEGRPTFTSSRKVNPNPPLLLYGVLNDAAVLLSRLLGLSSFFFKVVVLFSLLLSGSHCRPLLFFLPSGVSEWGKPNSKTKEGNPIPRMKGESRPKQEGQPQPSFFEGGASSPPKF